jgi:hypothetical protein
MSDGQDHEADDKRIHLRSVLRIAIKDFVGADSDDNPHGYDHYDRWNR